MCFVLLDISYTFGSSILIFLSFAGPCYNSWYRAPTYRGHSFPRVRADKTQSVEVTGRKAPKVRLRCRSNELPPSVYERRFLINRHAPHPINFLHECRVKSNKGVTALKFFPGFHREQPVEKETRPPTRRTRERCTGRASSDCDPDPQSKLRSWCPSVSVTWHA